VLAELLAIEIEEAVAMAVLFLRHRGEHPRRSRVGLAHRLREVAVGAVVLLLLERDREREQLLLGQFGKVLHARLQWPS
jgi:hypothetical protein